jgi:glycosyltransferase involved in cell wall biosynthesis
MNPFVATRASLIVSTADNPSALDLVLEGLSRQTVAAHELLIADDGSDAQTLAVIEKWRPHFRGRVERFWFPHEFYRRSVAQNAAVRAATGEYLIFLDGDCVPHRRFIADHLRHAERGAFVQGRRGGIRARQVRQLTGSRIRPVRLFLRGQLYGLSRSVRRPWAQVTVSPDCFIQGSNFAVWRDDFFRVNGYDETIVGHVYADTEFAARLSNAGLRCKKVVGQLIVFHLDHPRVVRYLTAANERILERTRREKRIRCEVGVTNGATPAPSDAVVAV